MTPDEIAKLPYRPGVGVVLTNGAGEVFAGERVDTPGAWQMPQGGIDGDETPVEAAWRELWEETGVTADQARFMAETSDWIAYDLPHDIVPRMWKGRFRGQKQKWVLFRFLGTDADIRIDGDHPEFARWRWIAPEDLLDQIVPFKRQVYDAVFADLGDRI